MKDINLHKLRCVIGAKAISFAEILISTLSENGSAIDLHFPANEAMQLNEYLGMAKKQIGWIVPEQVSNQTHEVPDQVYEIRKTGGIYITDDVNFFADYAARCDVKFYVKLPRDGQTFMSHKYGFERTGLDSFRRAMSLRRK